MRILTGLEPLCLKFELVNNLFISLSLLTNIIHLYNYENAINYEIGWNDYLIISFFSIKYNLMFFYEQFFMLTFNLKNRLK